MQKGLQTDILPKKPASFEPATPSLGLVEEELSKNSISIVDLVNALLVQAHTLRASDIHIDPSERGVKVRLRIDGVMHQKFLFPGNIHSEVISRIKVLSWLRTDEHQAAQDGRFRIILPDSSPIDVRVSITPTYYGENAVLRLLADKEGDFSLDALGFSLQDQEKITKAVKRPYGMILATGPTGSGKTTTLYTLIKMLNTKDVSIVTIEDPIEYAISDITQIQINPRTGLTFAQGLRSILRQDPNIIMVGEIRDPETASIAVNTALTGHLLLSTLHTSDASTTLPRLLDMGIDPYLVASTAHLAIGQRLVRRICKKCDGRGCEICDGSGYYGRICINEVLVVDQALRDAIVKKESADVIRKIAIKNGMTTMYEDGLAKVHAGETTMTELLRAINE